MVGEHRPCFGQQNVEDKSNKITAILKLIDNLDLEVSTVSNDAIGCQIEATKKILGAKANYLLAVKQNQSSLHEEISDEFTWKSAKYINE